MNPPGQRCSARGVRRQDLRHTASEVLHRREVQVLVGPVRARVVAEQAGDHELRLREHVPEHLDERDAPALADGLEVVAEEGGGRLGQHRLEPGRERRRIPTPRAVIGSVGDRRTVGVVITVQLDALLDDGPRLLRIDAWRETTRQLEAEAGEHHVAGAHDCRESFGRDDGHAGTPGLTEQGLDEIGLLGPGLPTPREVPQLIADEIPRPHGLVDAIIGDLHVELTDVDPPQQVDPAEHLRQHVEEGRRDDARRLARVHAVPEDVDAQHARGETAQRSGVPEPVVVPGVGVEAHHQAHVADAILELVDVLIETGAARLLGELDDHHAPGVGHALLHQGADGCERREDGVAVVRATATVELVALQHRRVRPEPLAPPVHGRLLVAVPVEEHGAGVGVGTRDLHEDQVLEALDALEGELHARDGLLVGPDREALDRFPGPGRTVVGRKARRAVGDTDVPLHAFEDIAIPPPCDVGFRLTWIETLQLCFPLRSTGSFMSHLLHTKSRTIRVS